MLRTPLLRTAQHTHKLLKKQLAAPVHNVRLSATIHPGREAAGNTLFAR